MLHMHKRWAQNVYNQAGHVQISYHEESGISNKISADELKHE
jgi:hypothetical protein